MGDNFHGSTFGPSAVGAINLASGMTGNVGFREDDSYGDLASDVVNNTVVGDPDPWYEDCISYDQASLAGNNIGDLLNAKDVRGAISREDSRRRLLTFQEQTERRPQQHNVTPRPTASTVHQKPHTPAITIRSSFMPPRITNITSRQRASRKSGTMVRPIIFYDLTYFWKAADSGKCRR